MLETAQDQYSLERSLSLSPNSMNAKNETMNSVDRELVQRNELLLFSFSLPFINPDYMQDLALLSTAHAPRFLLRHPTATRRGRHCRVTKSLPHTHTCARREGSAALTSLHAEDRHTRTHTQQKE